MCAKDGKVTGLRVDVIWPPAARFRTRTAPPTKSQGGFSAVISGSYDLDAAYVKVKAVYTNKAPSGVGLPLLVPRHRGQCPCIGAMVKRSRFEMKPIRSTCG